MSAMAPVKPAVFIDKDGTLVDNIPYNVDPEQIRLAPGAGECIAALHSREIPVFVVSNQPGVALGLFTAEKLEAVKARLQELLDNALQGFYFCLHHPRAGCRCRKPHPGLLLRAAREHGVSLQRSWMVGDILDDIEAGRRAGCHTILVDNGNETEWKLEAARRPDCIVPDLAQAAARILAS
jgi:histidinol-phosphate phosphatase family protein